jgi:4-diphosphocytidyl-2-C-methyl-D-erythritol kinase
MIELRAYAKINLGLRILARRPDGFHDIETIYHQINLFDEIHLESRSHGIVCRTEGATIAERANLCIKAARLLQSAANTTRGVTIHLQKNIPLGAGLGGGSADAAAVLKGLNIFWNLFYSERELLELATQLGSDVPFFIKGGIALGTGRGEILESLDCTIPYWIVVCMPPIHVSTAWAYSHISSQARREGGGIRSVIAGGSLEVSGLVNDFEPIVFRAYPEIAELKSELLRQGAVFALMSGSGSSVFGLFDDEESAKRSSQELSSRYRVSLTEPFFKPELLPIAH